MANVVLKSKAAAQATDWLTQTLELGRIPVVGEYVTIGIEDGEGCRVILVIHTPKEEFEAVIYGIYEDLKSALKAVTR